MSKKIILLAGPTASGKSKLAVHLAKKLNGEVINADSMQIYREFSILTSRPSSKDTKIAKHIINLHTPTGIDKKSLIDIYDSNNILVLPSFTEGQPHVVDESLARRRPVIVFEDIAHIINERKGVFVAKRTVDSFCETTKYIIQNYDRIQVNIEKNKFPLKKDMLKQISNIIDS